MSYVDGTNVTTTITVGSVEFIKVDSNPITSKRYIGGVAVISDSTATGHEEHVLLTDHLGSTVAIAKHTGLELQQMDYDAFGKRRNLWDLAELANAEKTTLNKLTTKGFTGHEMVDGVGVIHMKGRVYDPKLGRFLSADPYITELDNTQNMNRYSYVYNNPLTLVDPNGFQGSRPAPSCTGLCYDTQVTGRQSEHNRGGAVGADQAPGFNWEEDAGILAFCAFLGLDCGGEATDHSLMPGYYCDCVTKVDDPASEEILAKYNNGATFEDRANIYAEMASVLQSKGIDSKWFSVASDLMRYFADNLPNPGLLDKVNAFPEFARDLSSYLLTENTKTFDRIIDGTIDLTGKPLDYYLVQREQTFVESFIYSRYGDSGWDRPDFGSGGASVLATLSNSDYREAMIYATLNTPGIGFDYWDINERIVVGNKLVDLKWGDEDE